MGFFDFFSGGSKWYRLPRHLLREIKLRLGEQKFYELDCLAKKYNIFNQNIFTNPSKAFGTDLYYDIRYFAIFLTNVGYELWKHNDLQDAINIYEITLILSPELTPARSQLAFIYSSLGMKENAIIHAKQAVIDIDKENENDNKMPDEIKKILDNKMKEQNTNRDDMQQRNVLYRISMGESFEDLSNTQ